METILKSIPQRDPFLFVDKVIEMDTEHIHAQKRITGDEDFFKGHFPGNPVMPGVLLCECCFQAAAVLMSQGDNDGLGVVTRIKDTKFKSMAKPGDLLDIKVELQDKIANASYMKGKISIAGKTIMQITFQVASV